MSLLSYHLPSFSLVFHMNSRELIFLLAECKKLLYVLTHIQRIVEGLYCKRPIQCLASSEILTPHRPASVDPLAFGAGGGHTRWVERGWGVNSSIVRKTPDTALYSIYVST